MRKPAMTDQPASFALTLAMAGCKQETKAPEPVRPVLSTVVEPTLPVEHCSRGHC